MKKPNKQIPAIIAAFIITCLMAAGMIFIGGNALFNTDTVAVANSPSQAAAISNTASTGTTQAAQLQNLIAQYQQREKQYQTELQQANQELQQQNQQLQQVNQQLQQYQQLIAALQQRGVIQIDNQGNVYIPRGGFGNDFH